jgi:hypothetical protein
MKRYTSLLSLALAGISIAASGQMCETRFNPKMGCG